jgi:hypothetical protein
MKLIAALSLCFLACTARALDTDDLLDRVDAALSMAAFQDNVRLRLSGTIDVEGYHFQQPAPGLIDSNIDNLFNPRLTLFFDAQIGSQVYVFVQSRLDRGFDPSDHGAQVRLDEYATCRGRIRLSMRRWFMKTLLPSATKSRPSQWAILSTDLMAKNTSSIQ